MEKRVLCPRDEGDLVRNVQIHTRTMIRAFKDMIRKWEDSVIPSMNLSITP